jgi:hypothetical protein
MEWSEQKIAFSHQLSGFSSHQLSAVSYQLGGAEPDRG